MPTSEGIRDLENVHFSSKTDLWATPQDLYDKLERSFHFTLDPCATQDNAKCPMFYTKEEDGLAQSWYRHRVFMNPPYGREIGKWVAKAFNESRKGAVVVCLLPARTDTRWWQDYCTKGETIFLRGRLKFGESKNSAPFPSAIVVFHAGQALPEIVKRMEEE